MSNKPESEHECCEKCGDVYFEKDYPAHTAIDACTNAVCPCHKTPPSEEEEPKVYIGVDFGQGEPPTIVPVTPPLTDEGEKMCLTNCPQSPHFHPVPQENTDKVGWWADEEEVGRATQNLLEIAEGKRHIDEWNDNMSDLIKFTHRFIASLLSSQAEAFMGAIPEDKPKFKVDPFDVGSVLGKGETDGWNAALALVRKGMGDVGKKS